MLAFYQVDDDRADYIAGVKVVNLFMVREVKSTGLPASLAIISLQPHTGIGGTELTGT